MDLSNNFIGGLFALAAAAMWATASILWRKLGEDVAPIAMNLGKGLVALACFGAVFAVRGVGEVNLPNGVMLSLSGLLGISVGDTLFFLALMRLGPRRMMLMDALIPVATAGLAFVVLGERLSPLGWAGGLLVLGGVIWVMRERLPQDSTADGHWREGVWLAVLAVACNAVAILLAKTAAAETRAADATFVRILAGAMGLVVYGLFRGQLRAWLRPFKTPRLLGVLVIASFVGTFLGIWFAQAALVFTTATAATILKATTPIFVLPLAIVFLREHVSRRALLGACLAVAGVSLLLTS